MCFMNDDVVANNFSQIPFFFKPTAILNDSSKQYLSIYVKPGALKRTQMYQTWDVEKIIF